MAFQQYKIAAGWNNAAGLANVEDQFPRYQNKPLIVRGRGGFSPGVRRIRGNFSVSYSGKQIIRWRIRVMGINQYNYWQANYTTGGNSYSGKNTIRSRNGSDSFANYSVTSQLPSPDTLETKGDSYQNVEIIHVIEAAL